MSVGLPALVGPQGPRSEPGNLGPGWVGFDFSAGMPPSLSVSNTDSLGERIQREFPGA